MKLCRHIGCGQRAYARSLCFNHYKAAWRDAGCRFDPEAVDEINVELAMAGESVTLTVAERRECVRRLHRLRYSDRAIAERLGCCDKTVLRARKHLGLPAVPVAEQQGRWAA